MSTADMTGPALDLEKLGRFIAGESSPDEAAAMRRWLADHPFDTKFVEALDAAKLVGGGGSTPVDVEGALRRVRVRNTASSLLPERYMALAASAAIILVAGVIIWARSLGGPVSVVHTTGVGERDSVVLADGSRVLLGPATRLVARARDVVLTGEAYFTVVHDQLRPFTVRAGNAVIRDIGTEFAVRTDSLEPVRVVVREGAVELTIENDSVTLRPGDVGVVGPGGRVRASRGAATDDDIAWTQGRLVFRDALLPGVAADLRRWYGVELRVIDSSLLQRRFTGSFAGEPAHRAIDVIAMALGARVERRGDTAYIGIATPIK